VKYLVDANVLSEITRPDPSAEVVAWLGGNARDIAVDPVILGELRYGILLLPAGRKRRDLEAWFDAGANKLLCLTWDRETGLRWAELIARLKRKGTPMPVKDSMIAATALVHDLTVVTRNIRDFKTAGTKTLDPFKH